MGFLGTAGAGVRDSLDWCRCWRQGSSSRAPLGDRFEDAEGSNSDDRCGSADTIARSGAGRRRGAIVEAAGPSRRGGVGRAGSRRYRPGRRDGVRRRSRLPPALEGLDDRYAPATAWARWSIGGASGFCSVALGAGTASSSLALARLALRLALRVGRSAGCGGSPWAGRAAGSGG